MLNIIPDGYTEEGYVAEVPRLHGALRFRFRPMLPEERDAIDYAIKDKSPGQSHAMYRKALATRIQSWSEKDKDGNDVTVAESAIRNLRPALYDKLYNIVAGYRASDVDPNHEKATDEVDHELEAAITGQPVGDVRTEANAKN